MVYFVEITNLSIRENLMKFLIDVAFRMKKITQIFFHFNDKELPTRPKLVSFDQSRNGDFLNREKDSFSFD